MSKIIKGLILARSGSCRVKSKNIRPFAGTNLLTIKINQLMRINLIDSVIVNSNDDAILSIAKELGCETFKRDDYYATNHVSPRELYNNAALNLDGDIVVCANCTNPMLKDSTIVHAIETYLDTKNTNDSVNSVHPVKEFLFKDGRAINYDISNPPRSQDLPDIYSLNYAFNIISRENMINLKNIIGIKPYFYDIGRIEGIDIDDQLDFDFAEFYFQKYMNP